MSLTHHMTDGKVRVGGFLTHTKPRPLHVPLFGVLGGMTSGATIHQCINPSSNLYNPKVYILRLRLGA